jgi:BirA family biotin operon repressor/biotin-[acetyl-CoA-carboxylase] ligase
VSDAVVTSGAETPLAIRVLAFDALDSTNAEARRLAGAGASPGTVVWARRQTAGRGRRGRSWHSPEGNLFCTLLLRPRQPVMEAMQLGFVASLAVADAVAAYVSGERAVTCKWPNDVLVAGRKVSGILLESAMAADGTLDWLGVGVGINIRSYPTDPDLLYPATSLTAEAGSELDPDLTAETVLETLLGAFAHWHDVRQRLGFAAVRSAWLDRAYALGRPIAVRLEAETITGTFLGVDDDGQLLLGSALGTRTITVGDVFPATS